MFSTEAAAGPRSPERACQTAAAGLPRVGVLRRGNLGGPGPSGDADADLTLRFSSADVRSRYERLFKERQAAEQRAAGEGGPAAAVPPPIAPFQASISPAFTKHLS